MLFGHSNACVLDRALSCPNLSKNLHFFKALFFFWISSCQWNKTLMLQISVYSGQEVRLETFDLLCRLVHCFVPTFHNLPALTHVHSLGPIVLAPLFSADLGVSLMHLPAGLIDASQASIRQAVPFLRQCVRCCPHPSPSQHLSRTCHSPLMGRNLTPVQITRELKIATACWSRSHPAD